MENEEENNKKSCECFFNQTFQYILINIIVFDSISIICHIIYIFTTNWDFVHKSLFILSIISISFTLIILGFAICILVFKKQLYKNNIKYLISKIFSLVMLVLSPILFILNIFLSIYISIDLHIADYPEFGGRERDEKYIEEHPNKFGEVTGGEYVIIIICPSIVTIAHIVCFFFNLMLFLKLYNLSEEIYGKMNANVIEINNKKTNEENIQAMKIDGNLQVIKTDDRLYPNKINLPANLQYSKKKGLYDTEAPEFNIAEPEPE